MLYTPHFLAGAAILKFVPNPVVGLPLALISHILLDLLPHYDFDITPGFTLKDLKKMEKRRKYLLFFAMGLDFIFLILSFLWILFTKGNYWLLIGGGVAIAPDAIEQAVSLLLGKALPGWQDKLQFRVSAKYGFISYPIVALIALYFLMR